MHQKHTRANLRRASILCGRQFVNFQLGIQRDFYLIVCLKYENYMHIFCFLLFLILSWSYIISAFRFAIESIIFPSESRMEFCNIPNRHPTKFTHATNKHAFFRVVVPQKQSLFSLNVIVIIFCRDFYFTKNYTELFSACNCSYCRARKSRNKLSFAYNICQLFSVQSSRCAWVENRRILFISLWRIDKTEYWRVQWMTFLQLQNNLKSSA